MLGHYLYATFNLLSRCRTVMLVITFTDNFHRHKRPQKRTLLIYMDSDFSYKIDHKVPEPIHLNWILQGKQSWNVRKKKWLRKSHNKKFVGRKWILPYPKKVKFFKCIHECIRKNTISPLGLSKLKMALQYIIFTSNCQEWQLNARWTVISH